ncbi:L-2-amino-thiazoline-4-carboxylic acid hydrolase [bacterium]|nr:L-2-amino-thiazoline-4-carboxylic acid hydrolase [bacterium]
MKITPEFMGILENDAIMIATMGKAVKEAYGEEGLKILQDALEEKYKRIVPAAAKHSGARLNDGTIEDWVKVEQLFGKGMGIEGEFEVTPTRGLMRVTNCPYARQYAKVFPGICPEVLIGCERAIAKTINPKLQVRGQKYLTLGDDVCEIIVEFEK